MKKKVVVLSAILLLLALPAVWLNAQQGVPVGDGFLRRTGEGRYENVLLEKRDGVTYVSGSMGIHDFTAQLQWNGSVSFVGRDTPTATVTFPDGETVSGLWFGGNLCREDGMPNIYTGDMVTITINGEEPPLRRVYLADVICRMDLDDTEPFGSVWLVLVGIVMYALGALSLLFPNRMHFLGGRWAYVNPELSDEGRFFQRISGVVCMIASAVIMYLPLFT